MHRLGYASFPDCSCNVTISVLSLLPFSKHQTYKFYILTHCVFFYQLELIKQPCQDVISVARLCLRLIHPSLPKLRSFIKFFCTPLTLMLQASCMFARFSSLNSTMLRALFQGFPRCRSNSSLILQRLISQKRFIQLRLVSLRLAALHHKMLIVSFRIHRLSRLLPQRSMPILLITFRLLLLMTRRPNSVQAVKIKGQTLQRKTDLRSFAQALNTSLNTITLLPQPSTSFKSATNLLRLKLHAQAMAQMISLD